MPDFKQRHSTPILAQEVPQQAVRTPSMATHPIIIRDPVAMDAMWILRLYEYAMENGHFALQDSERIFKVIRQMIHQGHMLRQAERHGKTFVEAIKVWFRVAAINDYPVSFLLNAEREPGSQEIEVYQMGTRPQFMRRDLAQALLDDTLAKYGGRPFYARCYPPSSRAVNLLVKNGFKHFNTLPSGTRELKR